MSYATWPASCAKREVETVAVCFINAYANDANERRAAELLAEALPDVRISTSASVLPELFEHERFSTTVANAVLSPLVAGYVEELAAAPEDRGLRRAICSSCTPAAGS